MLSQKNEELLTRSYYEWLEWELGGFENEFEDGELTKEEFEEKTQNWKPSIQTFNEFVDLHCDESKLTFYLSGTTQPFNFHSVFSNMDDDDASRVIQLAMDFH